MTPRSLVLPSLCALLVPVVSALPGAPGGVEPLTLPGRPVVLAALAVTAQAPAPSPTRTELPVRAARVERRDATAGLAAAIAAVQRADAGPAWLAWRVPATAREDKGRSGRRDDGDAGRCVLEDDGSFSSHGGTVTGGTRHLVILARSEGSSLTRVAFTDERCVVDAGTRTVYWLEGVKPAESVAVLSNLVRTDASADAGREKHRQGRQALPALALHADPSVDRVLAEFVAPSQPRWLRRDAAFWLGAARGAAAVAALQRLARDDRDDDFREHLTFVLTLTGDAGLDTLIELARRDPSAKVRGQALFWLGQKAGQRATGTLTQALDDDPDRDVRKKAVFALSQLPKDEGVPKLISVARTHRDPEVRKQAMFWLGQSGDARAIGFFEEVLRK